MAIEKMKASSKTALILCVLEILKKYTDKNHPMTYKQIGERLESDYRIVKRAGKQSCIDRGTVATYVEIYNELGYGVKQAPRKGYYLEKNIFGFGEATFLIDSVFASKSLTNKQSASLTNKIADTLSVYQRKEYDYIDTDDEKESAVEDVDFFLIVELLCSAIIAKKQAFITTKSIDDNQGKRSEIKVSPYALLPNNDKYFLICYDGKRETVINIRVDGIEAVKLTKTDIYPLSQVHGFENGYENYFDDKKYLKEHPVFTKKDSGKVITATFKLENERDKTIFLDWFDKEAVKFERIENALYAKIKTSLQSIIYFCLQKGKFVELIEPIGVRKAIKRHLQILLNKYE